MSNPTEPGTRPGRAPEAVRAAAEARSAARAARDFATADRLRGEIEDAGWKVIDSGTAYRLEAAHPADLVEDGRIRYGRSDAVPSRLDTPPTGLATAVIVAREDPSGAARAAASLLGHGPAGIDVIVVADGLDREQDEALEAELVRAGEPVAAGRLEILRTSAMLGQGAALNIGSRRADGRVVIVLDASVEATGDVVTPLLAALEDPAVAVAGAFGLASDDLRHFREVTAGQAAAIEGYLQAFRRSDLQARGPIDEAFRFYRNLDIWWSLVLRDEGPDARPRDAMVVPGLPLVRHDHVAWMTAAPAERDRLSKRNFYRVLDRFRDRPDLAVPGG
jgi:hypothetical protein